MKQAIVTMDYKPNIGGIAKYWSHLFQELSKDDFVLVAPLVDVDDESGVIRIPFFYKNIWPKWLKLFSGLKKIISEQNIYHIIAGQVLPVGTVAYLLKKLGFIDSYSVSCHSMDIATIKGHKRFLAKIILRSARNIIVNSKYTRELVKDYKVLGRIDIVYPAPQSLPKPSLRLEEEYNWLSAESLVLLSVGRLVKRKGFDRVIEVLPRLWEKYPSLHYVIIGEGAYRKYLENLINQLPTEKQSQIHLLGELDDEDLVAWYGVADIFVLPSRDIGGDVEGFGMVNLEAALHKLPVISGIDGGVPETVLDNITGYTINGNSEDGNELYNKIVSLLDDPAKREKMGTTGYDFAKNFSWAKSAKVLIKNL